ncbi:competence protein CoiA [Alteribacter natronophilus]|uniref:competence protein CoiA n=1 Tax=Alteribacter natronophilus TaxID=2583810 RepID=UPI00110EFD80|nr:competence protein CoiA family protein [Alteribacter natronophilus]TMW72933.1 hypothetical protein FGB90_01075 [Alteribacter natronophilus]
MPMLTAVKNDGSTFILSDAWTRKELTELRLTEQFFCPECGEPLVLKLGTKKAWHFAHLHSPLCTASMKKETEAHVQGKWFLYNWLREQHLNPHIEYPLPHLGRRPDLCYKTEEYTAVIELQHSSIPFQQFRKRTAEYEQNGYALRWLGITENKSAGRETRVDRMSALDGFLASCPANGSILSLSAVYLNYVTGTFYFHGPFLFLSPLKVFIPVTPIRAGDLTADRLFHPETDRLQLTGREVDDYFVHWKKEVSSARSRRRNGRLNTGEKYISRLLCSFGKNLSTFPALAFIPLPSQFFLHTPPLLWQSWVLLGFINEISPGIRFSVNQLAASFLRHAEHQRFIIRDLPFGRKGMAVLLLTEYLDVLVSFGVLVKAGNTVYEVVRHITVEKPMDILLKDDEHIQNYMKKYWKEHWFNS